MSDRPAWLDKHPCVRCSIGLGECAQGLVHSMQCCVVCWHPGRWTDEPWTADDLAEMQKGGQ